MAKIISLIVSLLNIFRTLLYKFECFLLQFLPNDPNSNPVSDAYRRFKVHPLPVVEPEHLPISFDEAKATYEAKHNKPLKTVLRNEDKYYSAKGIVCPHCGCKLSLIKSKSSFDIYK